QGQWPVRYCSVVDRDDGVVPKGGPLPEDDDGVAFEWPSAEQTKPPDEELTQAVPWDELAYDQAPTGRPAFLIEEAAAEAPPASAPAETTYAPPEQPAPGPPPAAQAAPAPAPPV